jgi:hypothetical protein
MPAINQFSGSFLVQRKPLALNVGSVRTAHTRAFIKFEATPMHSIYNGLYCTIDLAGFVCIFYTQNELSTMLSGE